LVNQLSLPYFLFSLAKWIKWSFEHIYNSLLSDDARVVLCSLAASDVPLTRGVLTHISGLQTEQLDVALRDLALASLVIPEQERGEDDTILTKYSLLPLTWGYIKTKLQSQTELAHTIQARMEVVESHVEEAARAGKQYRYSLQHLGATTDEEKIAASWTLTGYQRYQSGDYIGAVKAFERAVEIAPGFARAYRNWSYIESAEGYYERATELLEKAVQLSPNDPSIWFMWGNMEKKRNRLDQARQHFLRALELSPNDGAVFGGLGDVEKRRENFQEAERWLKKALEAPIQTRGHKHKVISHTANADNLRRWSEALSNDQQVELATSKAREAYQHATRAVEMAASDERAQETLQECALQLAKLLRMSGSSEAALHYFQESIVEEPSRSKGKKTTCWACYYLCHYWLERGDKQKAEDVFRTGEKLIISQWDSLVDVYDLLRTELYEQRVTGKLISVVEDRGFGFIERNDVPGQAIFVHITQMVPKLSRQEFECLKGAQVSFVITETQKGPQAEKVRVIDKDEKRLIL
jgi:LuxR family transcriptional regulator, glucitol operon activator